MDSGQYDLTFTSTSPTFTSTSSIFTSTSPIFTSMLLDISRACQQHRLHCTFFYGYSLLVGVFQNTYDTCRATTTLNSDQDARQWLKSYYRQLQCLLTILSPRLTSTSTQCLTKKFCLQAASYTSRNKLPTQGPIGEDVIQFH